jgi:hypothetical protein
MEEHHDHVLGTISITVYLPADGSELEVATGVDGHLDLMTQLGALELARTSLYDLPAQGD